MRRPPIRTFLLPLAAAPLLLAGCSSADSGSSAAVSSSAAASSSADADAERAETFCTEVPELLSDISTDLQGITSAPETAPALLDEAVDRLSAVEPPADATPQWQRLVAAWTSMRDLLAQADLTNPAANADL